VKHDGYAERRERATIPAGITPSPRATTSRASTTFDASPERSRAAADSMAAAHATGLRAGVTSSDRASGARVVEGSMSSSSSASGVAEVTNVRPRTRVTASAGTRSNSDGKPAHGPAGSRSVR
jgi:hypothetical protein